MYVWFLIFFPTEYKLHEVKSDYVLIIFVFPVHIIVLDM